jgi:hypothetical protein
MQYMRAQLKRAGAPAIGIDTLLGSNATPLNVL